MNPYRNRFSRAQPAGFGHRATGDGVLVHLFVACAVWVLTGPLIVAVFGPSIAPDVVGSLS